MILNVLQDGISFTPVIRIGSSNVTSGYDERWGVYSLVGNTVIAIGYADHPAIDPNGDFIAMADLPLHADTVTPPDRAAAFWWHSTLLDDSDADVYVRMRTDIPNSFAYVNDSQGNLGRTSWNFSERRVRLGLFAAYRVEL